jgi:hypothetical protein
MYRALLVALMVVAWAAWPTSAQDLRGQERAVTRAEIEEKAEPGRTIEEVRAALGRPVFIQCGGRIQIWGYRTENGRIDLMFVNGVLQMTILGGVGTTGAQGEC